MQMHGELFLFSAKVVNSGEQGARYWAQGTGYWLLVKKRLRAAGTGYGGIKT